MRNIRSICRDIERWDVNEVQIPGNKIEPQWAFLDTLILAGIKRCRIVKDVFRNTKEKYDDLVMEIACGLHNFRVYHR